MSVPEGLLAQIKESEGFEANYYNDKTDGTGTQTIGHGFTAAILDGKDGRPNFDDYPDGMTEDQADEILKKHVLPPFIKEVKRNVKDWDSLNDAQQSSLVDLNYRNGLGTMRSSGIFKLVNNSDWEGVSSVITSGPLSKVGNKVVKKGDGYDGIIKRNEHNASAFGGGTKKDIQFRDVNQQKLGKEGFLGFSDLATRMGNNDLMITSASRDKNHADYREGSAHSEGNALDFGVKDGDGTAYMNFFFGPDATFKTKAEDLNITEEGRQYLIDNNAELLDERGGVNNGNAGDKHGPHPHFHLEFNSPEEGVVSKPWDDKNFQDKKPTTVGKKNVTKWGVNNAYYSNSYQESSSYESFNTQFSNLAENGSIDIQSDSTAFNFLSDLSEINPKGVGNKNSVANKANEFKKDIDEAKAYKNAANNNPLNPEEQAALETQIDNFSVQFYKDWDAGKYEDTDQNDLGTLYIEKFNSEVLGLGAPISDGLNSEVERWRSHYPKKTDEEIKEILIAKNKKEVAGQVKRGANPTPFVYNSFEGAEEMSVEELGRLQNTQTLFRKKVSNEAYAEKIQEITTGSKNGNNWLTLGLVDTPFEEVFEEIDGSESTSGAGFTSQTSQAYTHGAKNINPALDRLKNNPNVKKNQHGVPQVNDSDLNEVYLSMLEESGQMEDVRSGKLTPEQAINNLILNDSDVDLPDSESAISALLDKPEEEGEEYQDLTQDMYDSEGNVYDADSYSGYGGEAPLMTRGDYFDWEEAKLANPETTYEEYNKNLSPKTENEDSNNTEDEYFDLRGEGAFEESFLDKLGGVSSLIGLATGAIGLGAALKDVDIPKDPKLGPAFQQRLSESKRLAQQGLTPSELAKAHNDLDSSYATGIENIVRGSAGNRAQFMAGLGGLDVARQSALMDIAVADAGMQRQNQQKYDSMMMVNEQYEAGRQAKYQDAQFAQDTAKQAAGAALAGTSMSMISNAIGDRHLNRYNKMQTEKLMMDMGYKATKDGKSGQKQLGTDENGDKIQTSFTLPDQTPNLLSGSDQAVNTQAQGINPQPQLFNSPIIQPSYSNISQGAQPAQNPNIIASSLGGSTTSGLINYSNENQVSNLGQNLYDTFK